MAEASVFLSKKRYAVVTGGNKGIGLEICRQLASQGVVVVLTARDEKRGLESLHNLITNSGVSRDNLVFHQLDVKDPISITTLADFIRAKFGKLDILVNNAAILGAIVDFEALVAKGVVSEAILAAGLDSEATKINFDEMVKESNELVEECMKTNYYGVKTSIEALLPLLHLSDSPRIINVSSGAGMLRNIPNERVKEVLGNNTENLTEEKVDEVVKEYVRDYKDGSLKDKPYFLPCYSTSKAALNAYTRIMANKYPSIMINCICPGFVKTDITNNTGTLSAEEGAASPVKLALMPHGSPSGLYFSRNEVSSFV